MRTSNHLSIFHILQITLEFKRALAVHLYLALMSLQVTSILVRASAVGLRGRAFSLKSRLFGEYES